MLNLLCNKHGGCYEEKVPVMRDLTSSGASVNFTDGTSWPEVRPEVGDEEGI